MFVKVSLEIRLVVSDINKGSVKSRILTRSVYCVSLLNRSRVDTEVCKGNLGHGLHNICRNRVQNEPVFRV